MKRRLGKRFIIGFIIFIILLIALTATAIYYTIKKIDENEYSVVNEQPKEKKEAEDQKYAVNSYNETYNINSLEIKKLGDDNISYVQISGLKDYKVQRKINKKIMEIVESLDFDEVSTYVDGNFSNVLSISFHGSNTNSFDDSRTEYLNVDLTTGNEIKLTDLFVSSANLNLRIANAYYEELAWGYNDFDWEAEDFDYDKYYNMDYRDTSEYEDKILLLLKKFEAKKDNIKFTFTPSIVNIYDISEEVPWLGIVLTENIEEVAIYKRYLTDESIFVDDSIGKKNIIVFTDPYEYGEPINYGKISDNIFVEDLLTYSYNELRPAVKDFINEFSQKIYDDLKNEIKSDQGAIYQILYDIGLIKDEYTEVRIIRAKAICSKDYFDNSIFRDYVFNNNSASLVAMDYDTLLFSEYYSNDDLNVKNIEEYYNVYNDGRVIQKDYADFYGGEYNE